jgi:hypothetical protein
VELRDPIVAYTAGGNLEAHLVADWLTSNGVDACAVEDNSGVNLFVFGTISQFHLPQVFIERSDTEKAAELLRQYEAKKHLRQQQVADAPAITSKCEQCGATSSFPASQNGTVQDCPKCRAFMDVGTIDWPYDDDFGESE